MDFKFVKIVVFTPVSHSDEIRRALAEAGAGHIGNYDFCSFTSVGTGRFRGLDGSKPFIGKPGNIEEVREEKIEVICPSELLNKILESARSVHPYEEPAIDVYPLLNEA